GVLSFGLSGTTRGTQYGALITSGNVMLDGTLQVSLANFTPAPRDAFELFSWNPPSGAFTSVQLPPLGGSLVWNTSQLYTTGVISVIDSNFLPGDINRDGHVDVADVSAFAAALADLSGYQSNNGPGGSALTDSQLLQIADLTGDNLVTNADIQ